MLRHTKDVRGFKLEASNGELGKIKEFYFDDKTWKIRYIVADTGRWLPGRQILLSPVSLKRIDEGSKSIKLYINKEKIETSPSITMDRPVSRQDEIMLAGFYGWPTYWEKITRLSEQDPHLRSTKEVIGYTIETENAKIGVVSNFVIDDLDWTVKYMIVDTKKILPGRKVLLALEWIKDIKAIKKKIIVDVAEETVKSAPQYNPEDPINRVIETELFDHYRKKHYWL